MTNFPGAVVDYWHAVFTNGKVIEGDGGFSITLNSGLSPERRAMLLENTNGQVRAALTPEMAKRISLDQAPQGISASELRERLFSSGVVLHEPDFIFYLPEAAPRPVNETTWACRQLTEADRDAFDASQTRAPEQDLEDACVGLDHWAVFGAFDEDQLVCAASMYPWDRAPIADLGVLTLPNFRNQGYARAVMQAISQSARDRGYEPQYRCQLDNKPSVSLARACGFALFGKWETVASAAPEGPAAGS